MLAKPFEPQVAIELVRRLLAQPPLLAAADGRGGRRRGRDPSDWAADVSARPRPAETARRRREPAHEHGASETGAEAAKTTPMPRRR